MSVISGDVRDFAARPAEPDEVLLVAEIADSSLDRDFGDKYQLYADVCIPAYW